MNQKHAGEFSKPDDNARDRLDENHVNPPVLHIRAEFGTGKPDDRGGKNQRDDPRAVLQHDLNVTVCGAVALDRIRHKNHADDQQKQQKTENVGSDRRTACKLDYSEK